MSCRCKDLNLASFPGSQQLRIEFRDLYQVTHAISGISTFAALKVGNVATHSSIGLNLTRRLRLPMSKGI